MWWIIFRLLLYLLPQCSHHLQMCTLYIYYLLCCIFVRSFVITRLAIVLNPSLVHCVKVKYGILFMLHDEKNSFQLCWATRILFIVYKLIHSSLLDIRESVDSFSCKSCRSFRTIFPTTCIIEIDFVVALCFGFVRVATLLLLFISFYSPYIEQQLWLYPYSQMKVGWFCSVHGLWLFARLQKMPLSDNIIWEMRKYEQEREREMGNKSKRMRRASSNLIKLAKLEAFLVGRWLPVLYQVMWLVRHCYGYLRLCLIPWQKFMNYWTLHTQHQQLGRPIHVVFTVNVLCAKRNHCGRPKLERNHVMKKMKWHQYQHRQRRRRKRNKTHKELDVVVYDCRR